MKLQRPLIALVAIGLLILAGCSGQQEADLYAYGRQVGAPGSAPLLVDTSAVLFPLHPHYSYGVETAQLRFFSNIEDITPRTVVLKEPAEIRVGPGQLYEVATFLVTGTELTVNGQAGSWFRIADNGGYVLSSRIADIYPPGIKWQTAVSGEGSHEKVDECLLGVTNFLEISQEIGRPYYAMHSYCGGEPIALLEVGDLVMIDTTTYRVDSVNRRLLFGDAAMLEGIDGDAFLHSCDLLNEQAVILGLKLEGK